MSTAVFVTDTLTEGEDVQLFRIGRINVITDLVFTTPWGDTRNAAEYGADGVVDLPAAECCMRSELLRGEQRARAFPLVHTVVGDRVPTLLYARFREFAAALLRGDECRFLPKDGPAWLTFSPTWLQLRVVDASVVTVAVFHDRTVRVGSRDVNAAVWRTGQEDFRLELLKA